MVTARVSRWSTTTPGASPPWTGLNGLVKPLHLSYFYLLCLEIETPGCKFRFINFMWSLPLVHWPFFLVSALRLEYQQKMKKHVSRSGIEESDKAKVCIVSSNIIEELKFNNISIALDKTKYINFYAEHENFIKMY